MWALLCLNGLCLPHEGQYEAHQGKEGLPHAGHQEYHEDKAGATWFEAVPEAADPELDIQKQYRKTNSIKAMFILTAIPSHKGTCRHTCAPVQYQNNQEGIVVNL